MSQVAAAGRQLHTDMISVVDIISSDIHVNCPRLAVPASEEQCMEAVEALLDVFPRLKKDWEVRRLGLGKRLKREGRKLKRLSSELSAIKAETQNVPELNESEQNKLTLFETQLKVVSLSHAGKCDLLLGITSLETYLFQGMIHEMVDGQPQELQEWYFQRYFSNHVRPIWHTLPIVKFAPKTLRLSGGLSVPLEVMAMIYTHCDVESCAALYHLNSEWHSGFRLQPESIWRDRMKRQNPWMKPETFGIPTWAECVFVLGRRLRSSKWRSVTSLNDIRVTATTVKTISMTPWGEVSQQDLTPNSQRLIERPEEDERILYIQRDTSQRYFLPFSVVKKDEMSTVINYKGVEITLPARTNPQSIGRGKTIHGSRTPAIRISHGTIEVYNASGGGFILSRDKPHYRDGIPISWEHLRRFRLEGLFVLRDPATRSRSRSYSFVDLETRKLVRVCSADRDNSRPVAFVNGLVWWSLADGSLVPSVFDLASGKLFYRPDRALVGVPPIKTFVQQCDKSRGLGHLLFYENKNTSSISIVDLVSGCITSVAAPQAWKGPVTMTPGFDNGLFEVWCQRGSSTRTVVAWTKMDTPPRRDVNQDAANVEAPVTTQVGWRDMCVTI